MFECLKETLAVSKVFGGFFFSFETVGHSDGSGRKFEVREWPYFQKKVQVSILSSYRDFQETFLIGLDTLCKHNFGRYAIVGASSIMPA